MKFFGLLLLTAIAYLSYDLYFGRNGIAQYEEVSAQVVEARQKSELMQRRNQALQDEITDLEQGGSSVEGIARDDLGLVKEDETFYRIVEPETTSHASGD